MAFEPETIFADERWGEIQRDPARLNAARERLFETYLADEPERQKFYADQYPWGKAGLRREFEARLEAKYPGRLRSTAAPSTVPAVAAPTDEELPAKEEGRGSGVEAETGRPRTKLTSTEEAQFRRWYSERAERAGIDPNPDDPRHKYDYRGAFKAGADISINPEDGLYHWPSEFKDDDHPNRFVRGIDTKTGIAVAPEAGAAKREVSAPASEADRGAREATQGPAEPIYAEFAGSTIPGALEEEARRAGEEPGNRPLDAARGRGIGPSTLLGAGESGSGAPELRARRETLEWLKWKPKRPSNLEREWKTAAEAVVPGGFYKADLPPPETWDEKLTDSGSRLIFGAATYLPFLRAGRWMTGAAAATPAARQAMANVLGFVLHDQVYRDIGSGAAERAAGAGAAARDALLFTAVGRVGEKAGRARPIVEPAAMFTLGATLAGPEASWDDRAINGGLLTLLHAFNQAAVKGEAREKAWANASEETKKVFEAKYGDKAAELLRKAQQEAAEFAAIWRRGEAERQAAVDAKRRDLIERARAGDPAAREALRMQMVGAPAEGQAGATAGGSRPAGAGVDTPFAQSTAGVEPRRGPGLVPTVGSPPTPNLQPLEVKAAGSVGVEGRGAREDQAGLVDVPVVQVPAEAIALRPDLMQFKRIDDQATGINETDKLEGEWDDLKAGVLLLWEPAEPAQYGLAAGQRFIVANGHHRAEFGARQGRKGYSSQVVREADGVTLEDARALGAEINIADGKGTIYDQAKFLRNEGATYGADAALARARLIGAKGRKAASIAVSSTDPLFEAFINERLTPDQAEAIALGAPGNVAAQVAALKEAPNLSAAELKEFARSVTRLPPPARNDQGDLFGFDDAAIKQSTLLAKTASKLRSQANELQRVLGNALKRGDALELTEAKAAALGIADRKDRAQIQAAMAGVLARQAALDRWHTDEAMFAEVARAAGVAAPGAAAEAGSQGAGELGTAAADLDKAIEEAGDEGETLFSLKPPRTAFEAELATVAQAELPQGARAEVLASREAKRQAGRILEGVQSGQIAEAAARQEWAAVLARVDRFVARRRRGAPQGEQQDMFAGEAPQGVLFRLSDDDTRAWKARLSIEEVDAWRKRNERETGPGTYQQRSKLGELPTDAEVDAIQRDRYLSETGQATRRALENATRRLDPRDDAEERARWAVVEFDPHLAEDGDFIEARELGALFGLKVLPVKSDWFNAALIPRSNTVLLSWSEDMFARIGHEVFHVRLLAGDPYAQEIFAQVDPSSQRFQQYRQYLTELRRYNGLKKPSDRLVATEIAADFAADIAWFEWEGESRRLGDAFRDEKRADLALNRLLDSEHAAAEGLRLRAEGAPPPTQMAMFSLKGDDPRRAKILDAAARLVREKSGGARVGVDEVAAILEPKYGARLRSAYAEIAKAANRGLSGGTAATVSATGGAEGWPGADLGEPRARGADVAPADDREAVLWPVEFPEQVQLYRALTGGKFPRVLKALRALHGGALGLFRSQQQVPGSGSIELRADIFRLIQPEEIARMREEARAYAERLAEGGENAAEIEQQRLEYLYETAFKKALNSNPKLASKVLAHELFHFVDFLPEGNIRSRGNIFGHIAAFKKYFMNMLAELPEDQEKLLTKRDRQKIRQRAEKETGPRPPKDEELDLEAWRKEVAAKYAELIDEEAEKRGLVTKKWLLEELKPLIAWWRGSETMEEYFEPGKEMFAEAGSVFLNNPAAVQARAPLYFKLLTNWMERRPEVRRLYGQIQDDVKSGKIHKDRVVRLRQDVLESTETAELMNQLAQKWTPREWWDGFIYSFDRVMGPIYRRLKRVDQPTAGALRNALSNYQYRHAHHELYLGRVRTEVIKPLVAANLDGVSLWEFMFHQHVVNDRFDIANPYGWTPKASGERLAEMKAELGPEKWAALKAAQAAFWRVRSEEVIARLRDAGVFSPETMEQIEKTQFYATVAAVKLPPNATAEQIRELAEKNLQLADVMEILSKQYGHGVGPRIHQAFGYLGNIKNPFLATMQKDLSLLNLAHREPAKRMMVETMLDSEFAGEWHEAEKVWTGKRLEPKIVENERLGTVMFLDHGKIRAYYGPRALVEQFNSPQVLENRIAASAMRYLKLYKALWTQLRYGFWPVAYARDIGAFRDQLPGATRLPTGKSFWNYRRRALAAARSLARGEPNSVGQDALRRGMLISRAEPLGDARGAEQVERYLAQFNFEPASWERPAGADQKQAALARAARNFWHWYRSAGQIRERTVKIAGMMFLDEQHPQMPEWKKQEMVHELAGSPDFMQKGRLAWWVDMLFPFYNPVKEGVRSSVKSWTQTPGERAWKYVKYVLLPALAIEAMRRGLYSWLLGDEKNRDLQRMMLAIPRYDWDNYKVYPLGWTDRDNDKVAYLRVPLHEQERLLHAITMKALRADEGGADARNMMNLAGGQLPGLNPLLSIGQAWHAYSVMGVAPQDSYYGRSILTDDQVLAGRGATDLLKYSWNQLGGGIVYQFRNQPMDREDPTAMERFLSLPIISDSLGRWVKVSNRGITEKLQDAGREVREKRATIRLDVQDSIPAIMSGSARFTEDQRAALMTDYGAEYLGDRLQNIMVGRSGPEIRALQGAQSAEEKQAVMDAIMTLPQR